VVVELDGATVSALCGLKLEPGGGIWPDRLESEVALGVWRIARDNFSRFDAGSPASRLVRIGCQEKQARIDDVY